jgi:hypothetical protein
MYRADIVIVDVNFRGILFGCLRVGEKEELRFVGV